MLPYLRPADVATRLGITTSGLRRLGDIYEEVHGELPRDEATNSRLWPDEAVDRLEAARFLVSSGRSRTVKEALVTIETSNLDLSEIVPQGLAQPLSQDELLNQFAEVVRQAVEDATREQARELRMLHEHIRDLEAKLDKALTALPEQSQPTEPPSRPWWRLWARG
jgi:hypothetical protein